MNRSNTRTIGSRRAVSWKAMLLAGVFVAGGSSAFADTLADGFRAPPSEARPRVWWHWLNGAISQEGLKLDLEWMQRAGLGGVQIFTGAMPNNERVLASPVTYMSPEWRAAMRAAVTQADAQGMEVTVATSPGWSETGAPFVKAQDGMKKLVWTETEVRGGRRFNGPLPKPSDVSGPISTIPHHTVTLTGAEIESPRHYADSRVIAYRVPEADHPLPSPKVTTADGEVSMAGLFDGKLEKAIEVHRPTNAKPAWIRFDYPRSVTIRSVTAVLEPKAREIFTPAVGIPARLEVSEDGVTFREATELTIGAFTQNTSSFAPVTGRSFRIVLQPEPSGLLGAAAGLTMAPGAILQPGLPSLAVSKRLTISEMALSGEARIHRVEEKAGFASVKDYYAVATPDVAPDHVIRSADVVDLTDRMTRDGILSWTAPKGQWRVLRIGHSLTGHMNGPAPAEATGLEVDKLSAPRVQAYMQTYLDDMTGAIGADLVGERGLQAVLSDSIESGFANWTDDILDQFKTRRGYDPIPYLPALTGRVVDSAATSDAFLYDFRRTLADLLAEAHYGEVSKAAKARGLKVYGEALESGDRPSLGDDMAMRSHADIPMGAMWTYGKDKDPAPNHAADIKGAASVANLYGRRYVGAESMTSMFQYWAASPRDIKRVADMEMLLGVNRFSIHSSVHQPLLDKKPGLALWIFGQYFNRNETWAEQARPWIDYLARNSWVLSQGRFSADVAYFYGEEAPIVTLANTGRLGDVPTRYGYDYVNAQALTELFAVDDGVLTVPSGMRYRVLQLGGASDRMTLPVLQKIHTLVEAGAVVVGEKPVGSPSLADDQAAFGRLADLLWAGGAETRLGAGRVIAGRKTEEVLASLGAVPDNEVVGQSGANLLFHHRLLGEDGDVWFVTNPKSAEFTGEIAFRVTGREPELWDAETGTTRALSYRTENGRTIVPMTMDGDGSALVVFRKPTSIASRDLPTPTRRVLATLAGDWDLSFQKDRGAPEGAIKTSLASWTQSDLPGVKYFSGVGTYTKTVDVPRRTKGGRVILSLGEVNDVAEVLVNGRPVRTVWRAPYRLDITDALRPGKNQIEVRVANLWVNRLIGDAQPGAEKVTWTVAPAYSAKAPLRPSGLIGPVTLEEEAAP